MRTERPSMSECSELIEDILLFLKAVQGLFAYQQTQLFVSCHPTAWVMGTELFSSVGRTEQGDARQAHQGMIVVLCVTQGHLFAEPCNARLRQPVVVSIIGDLGFRENIVSVRGWGILVLIYAVIGFVGGMAFGQPAIGLLLAAIANLATGILLNGKRRAQGLATFHSFSILPIFSFPMEWWSLVLLAGAIMCWIYGVH
jgi:hypothetical protein